MVAVRRSEGRLSASGGLGAGPAAKGSAAEHLSPAAEVAIRLLPGNERCADCKAVFPQWAGVSFGILLCLGCAGRHRSLGVRVSVVKSLAMDSWSVTERRALEVGGNAKWGAVCAGTATSDLPLADKYCSSIAAVYKSRVMATAADPAATQDSLTATQFLSMLSSITAPACANVVSHAPVAKAKSEPLFHTPLASPDSTDQVPMTEVVCVKCTTCHSSVPIDSLNEHSSACTIDSSTAVIWQKYERELGSPGSPLGFSLTKTNGGYAEVSRVTPGGEADAANVLVGSFVVGLNDQSMSLFDEVVARVRTLPRPIRFHFAFRPTTSTAKPISSISSVPEPVSVDVDVKFEDPELGCSFEATEFGCVVKSVDCDGAAGKMGVLVGCRVIAVNGRRYLKPSEVLQEVTSTQRPLRIKFHRVEGLMLGWRRAGQP